MSGGYNILAGAFGISCDFKWFPAGIWDGMKGAVGAQDTHTWHTPNFFVNSSNTILVLFSLSHSCILPISYLVVILNLILRTILLF